MGSLVQLGDLPAWIGAATGAAGLYLGLRDRQQAQALDFAQVLEQLAGLTPEELRRTVEDNPMLAQMVDLAWEEAARTASEDKRRLLAKVVAAALRGAADAEVDALPFLLRAVMALDPGHVTLLVIVATPQKVADDGPADRLPEVDLENAVGREELLDRWPAADDLLDPALAALDREGLVLGVQSLDGETRWWALRPFGRRFFDFLQRVDEAPGA
jgi:hypothetical protein